MKVQPPDACPYFRPHPEDFKECGAYLMRMEYPETFFGDALTPHPACVHLIPRSGQVGQYAACALGTAEQRADWVKANRADQLHAMAELRRQLYEDLGESFGTLYHLKRAQQRSRWNEQQATSRQLEELSERLIADFQTFIQQRGELLQAIGVEADEVIECFTAGLRYYVGRRDPEWRVSDSVLIGRPWEIKLLFRPDLIGRRAQAAPEH